MRSIIFPLLILCAHLLSCKKDPIFPDSFYQCRLEIPQNQTSSIKSNEYQSLLTEMIQSGVPGAMLSIRKGEEYWAGANGFADLASQTFLESCNITRVGSTVKTFTGVTILLLQEDGLLDIDDPITDYLSNSDLSGLENAKKSSIRQLLQHSSGIFNYIQNNHFQTASLNELTKTWRPDELLDYARGVDAYFSPGTDVLYSNTNYVLLGMIIEKVSKKPFYKVFEERIFQPHGLFFTQFAATDPVPDGIIRGYVDLYSNLNLINATYYSGWDYNTADGGLISNAHDLNLFMTALFHGDILSPASLEEMLSWQAPKHQSKDGYETFYGLGIFKINTPYGPAYMHSGDAIGYFASMLYFPTQDATITWAVNGNYGKIDQFTQSEKAMNQIFETVFGD